MTFKQEYEAMKRAKLTKEKPAAMATGHFDELCKFIAPKSAAQMEAKIVAFLKLKGHQAETIKTSGNFKEGKKNTVDILGRNRVIGKGKYIPGTGTKGSADVSSTIFGLTVKWEVKFSKSDRQSEAQKVYEANVIQAKGFYFVVRTLDEFYLKYYELIELPQFQLMKGFE